MSYVIIKDQPYTTDTEKDVLLARFEMACAGIKELPVFFGEPNSPDSYQSETIRIAVNDLQDLLELLKEAEAELSDPDAIGDDVVQRADLCSLPTYGGEWPADTLGVWSWDERRLLVGTCIDDMKLVTREEVTQEKWDCSDYLAHGAWDWADLCRDCGVDPERSDANAIATVVQAVICEAVAAGVSLSKVTDAVEELRAEWEGGAE